MLLITDPRTTIHGIPWSTDQWDKKTNESKNEQTDSTDPRIPWSTDPKGPHIPRIPPPKITNPKIRRNATN